MGACQRSARARVHTPSAAASRAIRRGCGRQARVAPYWGRWGERSKCGCGCGCGYGYGCGGGGCRCAQGGAGVGGEVRWARAVCGGRRVSWDVPRAVRRDGRRGGAGGWGDAVVGRVAAAAMGGVGARGREGRGARAGGGRPG